ncbi:EamA family transporter [Halobacterium sp. KA-6]|uniref:EamA family transporter n=1 Tax=Halobacterium sp. KA-6 TaxID=2896368 RepID=UPI001E4FC162|nr:EamA family transporter [Halobacterium sp. KA-6]MCD2202789.1 DMT family transporter [Halobacterium sp. KA-6]
MESGLLYALAAAGLWGVYLFALKRYFVGVHGAVLTVFVNAAAIAWYLPFAVATGGNGLPAFPPMDAWSIAVFAGTVVFGALAFIVSVQALAVGDVSYVAPIAKIVPVFVVPIEVLVLGAYLEPTAVAGIVVATTAVYLANYEGGDVVEPFRRAVHSRAAQLALVSAALFAVSDVGRRVVLDGFTFPTRLWVPVYLGSVAVVVVPLALRRWPTTGIRPFLGKFAVTGAGVAVAEHVTALAFASVPASIASTLVNGQAIVAVLLGCVLLGEPGLRRRLGAAVLAVVGVGLIAV